MDNTLCDIGGCHQPATARAIGRHTVCLCPAHSLEVAPGWRGGPGHVSGPTFETADASEAETRLKQIAATLGGPCDVVSFGRYTAFVPGLVIVIDAANAWLCRVSDAGRLVGCEAAAWWSAHGETSGTEPTNCDVAGS